MDGVLVVDKPRGMTSFDVVRQLRHASGVRRVGHGGTLDPMATGVLPVCLGEATKLAQFLLDADKVYDATICFGVETDTYDADGVETRRSDASGVTEAQVVAALPAFRGAIRQKAPAYSALKRDGEPLYAYARRGEAVDPPERTVVVHELALAGFDGPGAVAVRVRCSKGTYIRSLAFDLGRALGPGGHLTALRRTRSGPFAIESARPLAELVAALRAPGGAPLALIGLAQALGHLPRLPVDASSALAVRQGKPVAWSVLVGAAEATSEAIDDRFQGRFQLVAPGGGLLAVAERGPDGMVRSLRVFNDVQTSAESGKRASV
ncbi:MAG: tRNA pseudouridine55 synthase [Myxococcales bacterium]|jgi:tRNA pseudouridine55 synthase|nr:tRNA pseudouridine55 synthase [Myxococcales bacterium]